MSATLSIFRAGPLTTIQDAGRFGALAYGIAASGPMDQTGWAAAGGARTGIEFTTAGIDFSVDAPVTAGFAGGAFTLRVNGEPRNWPSRPSLGAGDTVSITPGAWGNFGYVRFDREIEVSEVIGSRATNLIAGLGGLEGRALRTGDVLTLGEVTAPAAAELTASQPNMSAPLRFVWGLHADLFAAHTRAAFVANAFGVSSRMDRMGMRLTDTTGVFADTRLLSLVSDSVVPGDIQILGDGTPIVLKRDHQPTGGYPRIGTLISEDINRLAQMRPGTALRFAPVSLKRT